MIKTMARGGGDNGRQQTSLADLVAHEEHHTAGVIYITNGGVARRTLARLSKEETLGLDIETADSRGDGVHNGVIRTVQLGISPEERYVFDLHHLSYRDAKPVMRLLRMNGQRHVVHSATYEQRWLWYHYGVKIGNLFDTAIAAKVLREVEGDRKDPVNLAAVSERELGIILDKEEQSSHWGREPLTINQIVYAANDVSNLNILADIQEKRLREHGLWEKFEAETNALYRKTLDSIHDKKRYMDDDWPRVRAMVERAHTKREVRSIEQMLPQLVLAHHHRHRAMRMISERLLKA